MPPSNIMTWRSHLGHLSATAQQLLVYAGTQKLWLFHGALGAGKTTLIKAICTQLGVKEKVTSPTFALAHEYIQPTGEPVYHLDAYRIEHEKEALALDYPAYWESGCYCFLEWPSKVANLLPPSYLSINITTTPNQDRALQVSLVSNILGPELDCF